MRKYLLIGMGVALLAGAGAAFAQMGPGGPHGRDGMDRDRMDRFDDGDGPDAMAMMHRMHHRHSQGAAFRLKRGDMEIDVRCSPEEPMSACVNAASMLLDKANGNTASPAPSAPRTP